MTERTQYELIETHHVFHHINSITNQYHKYVMHTSII